MKQNLTTLQRIAICISFCFVMVILVYIWSSTCHQIYTGGARHFFRYEVIFNIKYTVIASLKEEMIWRFLPFLLTTILIESLRNQPRIHKTLLILSTIFIVLIQIQFGYAHYHPNLESQDWAIKHIIIQGLNGLCFALTYACVLFLYYYKSEKKMVKLLVGNLIAFIASNFVHITSNILLIINQTFGKSHPILGWLSIYHLHY